MRNNLRQGRDLSIEDIFPVDITHFSDVPDSPLSYWVPQSLRNLYRSYSPLDPTLATVKEGISPIESKFFYSFWWEVPRYKIGPGKKFVPIAHGAIYSPYYRDIEHVVEWENDGERMKQAIIDRYPYLDGNVGWKIKNTDFWYHGGFTFGKRTDWFNVKLMPPNVGFSNEANAIFPNITNNYWLLGLLNSVLIKYLINMIASVHKQVKYVSRIPVPSQIDIDHESKLTGNAENCFIVISTWDRGNETCTQFTKPWLLQLTQFQNGVFTECLSEIIKRLDNPFINDLISRLEPSLHNLLNVINHIEDIGNKFLENNQKQINQLVFDIFMVRDKDCLTVYREVENCPRIVIWPQMEGKSETEKQHEHVRRFFSYFVLNAISTDEDGVIPLSGTSGQQPYLIDKVRTQMEELFGAQTAYQFEQDAAGYLGRPLEEWLVRDFFAKFHVKLYKNRPILWHLTSPKGYFAVLLDYHRLDRDTLPKVQALYLWPQMEAVRSRLNAARQNGGPAKMLADLEEELADLKDCDERLSAVIQGTVKVELPEWAHGPYRDGKPPYDPDLDDGVRVNLLPIQEAGLLPVKKVV